MVKMFIELVPAILSLSITVLPPEKEQSTLIRSLTKDLAVTCRLDKITNLHVPVFTDSAIK